MTQLRQRMTDDMTVRGLAENTKKSYLNSVAGLARHYRRRPDRISAPEVQDYLLHLHEQKGLTWQSCNCVRHGVRFLYRITLGLPDPHFYLPGAKTPSTLPRILNRDELVRLFTVTTNRKHRALLMTAYAAGLRASELGRLQLSDIDSERMCLRVDQGKGNKDRYVPLSPRLLDELRAYWRRHRPRHWLFPSDLRSRPMMTRAGPAHIYKAAKDKARIDKPGGIHTLRHCYATGLLEAGVELHVIQRRLGHSSIRSTMRYLHLAHDKTSATPSPLDLLADIPHIPSKFVEIVPLSHRQGNCIPYAAIRWHDFGNRPALGRPLGHFFRHPDTPLLSLSPRRRFPRPTPERVFVADHQSSSGFSGTGPSAPPPQPIGT